jgi:cellulose synthase/poly-beta-1,6-N-acetylglucosamine synthase-like glycosyltransferase
VNPFLAQILDIFTYAVFYLTIVLVVTNFAAFLAVYGLHISTLLRDKKQYQSREVKLNSDSPFVSVHIPTYDEPPALVIETLRALSNSDYPNFEVIILDNNTPSRDTWLPVKTYCEALGPRFRFYHFDDVTGAKAGALNIGMELVSSSTKYIAVVDADYQVLPNFISLAIYHLEGSGAAFVQFPQAYRGVDQNTVAIEEELSDYFRVFAPTADKVNSALLTGTLSVISRQKLTEAGGWDGSTITEDAELGVRMVLNGSPGKFLADIGGYGLLPLSLHSLKAQRNRWVVGNLQTLRSFWREILSRDHREFRTALLSQLTAWSAFWLIPIVVLIFGPLGLRSSPGTAAVDIAAMTVIASAALIALRIALSTYIRGNALSTVPAIFLVKLSVMVTSSIGCATALLGIKHRFSRTSKSVSDVLPVRIDADAVVTALAGIASLVYLLEGRVLCAIACGVVTAALPAGRWVDNRLSSYALAVRA